MLETWLFLAFVWLLSNSTPRFVTDDEELREQPSAMITGILLIGLGFALGYRRIQKTGTAVQSPTRLPVWLKLWEERSALRLNYNRNMDSTKEKFTALQREID